MFVDSSELDTSPGVGDNAAVAQNPYVHHVTLLSFTLIWGGNFVLAEVALQEMSPISFSVSRFLVAGLALLGFFYVEGYQASKRKGTSVKLVPALDRSDWFRLVVVSILGATLAPWLGIEGLNLTSSGRASIWLALCPVLSAGIGIMLRTETIRKIGLLGLFIAGLGTVGLAADGFDGEQQMIWGDLYLLLAICCIAAELHLMKPLVARHSSTSMVAARTVIGGTIYFLVASPSLIQQSWFSLGAWTWIAILAGGIIGVGIGQWTKVRALDVLGPTRVVLYGNLVPPATLLIAWIALGTNPTWLESAAAVLIFIGAACLQLGDPHRRYEHIGASESGTYP